MPNMNIEQELLQLKEDIAKKQKEKDTLQGKLEHLYGVLQKDYGVSTIEEASIKLEKLQSVANSLTLQIDQKYKALKDSLSV